LKGTRVGQPWSFSFSFHTPTVTYTTYSPNFVFRKKKKKKKTKKQKEEERSAGAQLARRVIRPSAAEEEKSERPEKGRSPVQKDGIIIGNVTINQSGKQRWRNP
jgi:hypothetical protein